MRFIAVNSIVSLLSIIPWIIQVIIFWDFDSATYAPRLLFLVSTFLGIVLLYSSNPIVYRLSSFTLFICIITYTIIIAIYLMFFPPRGYLLLYLGIAALWCYDVLFLFFATKNAKKRCAAREVDRII